MIIKHKNLTNIIFKIYFVELFILCKIEEFFYEKYLKKSGKALKFFILEMLIKSKIVRKKCSWEDSKKCIPILKF